MVEWPANAACYQLETTDSLETPNWSTAALLTPELSNGWQRVTLPPTNAARFFRLKRE